MEPVPTPRRRAPIGLVFASALALGCYQGVEQGDGEGDADATTTAASSTTTTAGDSGDDAAPGADAGPAGLRLLTVTQYRNSVIDVLGVAAAPAVGQWRSSIAAAQGGVAAATVEDYEEAAMVVTGALFADPEARAALAACEPALAVDDPCVAQVITTLGRRAWRRPLAADEVARYTTLAAEVAQLLGGDPWAGLQHAVAGLLHSPNFLYRVELGAPVEPGSELLRLGGYELASRLSYLVWNSTPDAALLDAAAAGELDDPAGLAVQLERLLADPRARGGLVQLFVDMLDLDVLLALQKDAELLPAFTPTIGPAMREELVRVIEDALFTQRDVRRLFDGRTGFVNDELAALYGVAAPAGGEFAPVELPAARGGLLTLAGFLAINSGEASTSPTMRGLTVRRVLMCQNVPPPPPDVAPELPDPGDDTPMTKRELLKEHASNPACAACHQFTDPIGLALEHFDALGGYRETDRGLPIDPSGLLDGQAFADAVALGGLFTEHPAVGECLVRNLYRYGTGHVESPKSQAFVAGLRQAMIDGGYDLTAAVDALARSDAFRYAIRLPEDSP